MRDWQSKLCDVEDVTDVQVEEEEGVSEKDRMNAQMSRNKGSSDICAGQTYLCQAGHSALDPE